MAILRCPTCHREFERQKDFLRCPYDGAILVDPASAADPFIGRQLADTYQLVRRIGVGGMGSVYEARHLRLETSFAVKLLRPELAISEEMLARFHREARSASQLRHPNIIEVIDVNNTADRIHYIIQEYLDGEPLSGLLHREQVLGLERGVRILAQVCDAMAAAHEKGIVHRDLKPENIFLIERGGKPDHVKVLDFGIAKMQQSGTKLTRAATAMGTPDYIPPEQAESADAADFRSDIYSLGVVIYRCFTGRLPYEIENPLVALDAVRFKDPVPPRDRRPDLPAEVEAVIVRSMARAPGDRHGSMAALKQALEALVARETSQPEAFVVAPTMAAEERRDPSVPRTIAASAEPRPDPTGPPTRPPASAGTDPGARRSMQEWAQSWTGGMTGQQGGPPGAPGRTGIDGAPTPLPVGQIEPTTAYRDAAPRSKTVPFLIVAVIVLLGGGVTAYLMLRSGPDETGPGGGQAKEEQADAGRRSGGGGSKIAETLDAAPTSDAGRPDRAPAAPAGMVAVKGGTFLMGRKDGHTWERPQHRCTVGDFHLDADEVTRGEFAAFLDSPAGAAIRRQEVWAKFKVSDADRDLPATHVTWAEADAYCRSVPGRRLPTEAEWEYAARGPSHDGLYPTGAAPPGPEAAHFSRPGKKLTTPRARGQALGGISDLIGNAAEWVQDTFALYTAQCGKTRKPPRHLARFRVIRGGGFGDSDLKRLTATFRIPQDPSKFRWKSVGFRCARSDAGAPNTKIR
jgi:serine/threonine-protein kinase